ncbi:cysteine sulfinate desulfinase [Pedobacter antarcticus 4BY]|uniref:Cysteine desulfurase n=2 Tax=Pedobacter antarcticus TaxID=34086 RepID=A0A081PEU4_9SPHI|nr:cysteine desulfurase [Pedobacter antarcticus]KEQ29217.1 cysteine sulfinate desulfinase [Pedobacter antarcticus 4BY]SFE99627.1 cysteine desulfurase / selenocysteine lyase [Pedobacter antarcticus]
MARLDTDRIRKDFPILSTTIYGKPLVYLDNAATTQKPVQVLDMLEQYYREYNSNVHRGVHLLSQQATAAYEQARKKVAAFIGAAESDEVIFTKGTTDGINLVASSYGRKYLQPGDSVLISAMEHHSNIVPWQMICEERGAVLKVIPMDKNGVLKLDELPGLLDEKVKIVSLTYVSNSLGTVNPVHEVISQAHAKNIPVLLDAAQAVQHFPIDVQELDVDFLVFSGHKLYGPTGIGVLYGKSVWLNDLPPYQGGGDMIKTVTFAKTVYNVLPYKFEAGTPDISGAVGLGKAIDYITELGLDTIREQEDMLVQYALTEMAAIPGIRFIGQAEKRSSVVSFLINDIHPYDLGELLDKQGIAIRTGHHCTEPVMDYFGIPGTCRASFAFYNTTEEIDLLVAGIKRAAAILQG